MRSMERHASRALVPPKPPAPRPTAQLDGGSTYPMRHSLMPSLRTRIVRTKAPASVLLVRLLVGAVFLSEGVQKFLYPDALGAGRFAKIGIPAPDLTAPFVGGVEILFGSLLLLGLLTRLAAI